VTAPRGTQPLFRWRWAVASKQGPRSSVTRHVLLTVSLHMDLYGQGAFPSIALVATESGLSSRAVGMHLKKATNDGWISRKLWRAAGKDWAQYVYVATLPPGIDGQEPRSLPNPQGQESDAIGAEPDSTLVRNDVPTNSTRNSTYNSTEPLAKASEKQESIAGKEAFRQLFEKMKGRVPEDG
jgi:hypothetical protein